MCNLSEKETVDDINMALTIGRTIVNITVVVRVGRLVVKVVARIVIKQVV